MLQQTRVETVERYWSGFIARFPDVGALAAADDDEVLAAWSGLGYYRRARLLHAGAKRVAADLGARLPQDVVALRQIPGIGAYTAGAIASIAFDRPEPLVDGNVARVLCRLEAVDDPRLQVATSPWLWAACAEILRRGTPRVLGQALMELGATVCTPRAPRCSACPVAAQCRARQDGSTDRIPAPRERVTAPVLSLWALAVMRTGAVLVTRRADEGLLAGMWCLPLVPRTGPDVAAPARADIGALVRGRIGAVGQHGPPVTHVFTHRRWSLQVVTVEVGPGAQARTAAPHVWLESEARPPGGLPAVTRKLLARVRSPAQT